MPFTNTSRVSRPALRICSILAWSIVLAVALLMVCVLPAQAAPATVAGKITGKLPSSSRAVTEIRAFDIGRALLVAKATAPRSGSFRLSLPAGAYVLETSITPERGRKGAGVRRVTPVTLAVGQRRGALKIAKPTAGSSDIASAGARAAYSQESGAITPGTIAFSVENFAGATGDLGVMNSGLTWLLQTDLASTPCRSAEVANASDRAVVERELAFGKSKYVDPSTRITRNFVLPDIVVRGRLQTHGKNLGYLLTLVDGRTGILLETVSGTLAGNGLFGGERRLAAQLANRLCAYGEVFEVTFTGTGMANFAPYSATGRLNAETVTAKPTQKDALGPIAWEGSAPVSWINETVTSKTDCSYTNFVSGGTWTAKLTRVGDQLQVQWLTDPGSTEMVTALCPNSEGGQDSFPGLVGTALLDSQPSNFLLPADATQKITMALDDQGFGWKNDLALTVRTVRVAPLG